MRKNIQFIAVCLLVVFFVYVAAELIIPLPAGSDTKEIYIPKGTTFRQAIEILAIDNLVRDKNLFLFFGRLTGLHKKIRAGYYSLSGVVTPIDVLRLLRAGRIVERTVTIIEGDSLYEIAERLSEKNIVDKDTFKSLSSDKDFLASYNIDAPSIEGYIYPDTYHMPKGIDPQEAVGQMVDSMRSKYPSDFWDRAEELRLSEREVLTLASIIEKEAVIDSERPLISAVYHNRLRKKMPLQADPTAVYGIKSSRLRITLNDLKRKTPYNTYVIKGLPPGPIASPSIESIKAALRPANVPYLYFVSNNDGSHKFSVTVREHNKAVEAYRSKKKQKANEQNNKTNNNERNDKKS